MREIPEYKRDLARRLHEQRLEATGRIMASIAHDLRTPLSSIIFNVDFMLTNAERMDTESTRSSLGEIRVACDRLRATIDGLLDFARLGVPVVADVSLAKILDRVASLLRSTFRDGRHVLDASISPSETICGNPLVVEQIFVNLLMNAVEAASTPITVMIRSTRSRRTGSRGVSDAIVVTVSDNGPGIPVGLRANVFEPFFTTKQHGTGLGLAMSREASRQLGGDLLLVPTERGACFALVLPAGRTRDLSETGV
jgi:signal transduction histidine kinase